MTSEMAFPVDDFELWNSEQSWHYEQHWSLDDELVRVQIKRNAYDDQSRATVSIWSDASRGWNHLTWLHITKLDCSAASYTTPAVRDVQGLFTASCRQLIERAATILNARPSRVRDQASR